MPLGLKEISSTANDKRLFCVPKRLFQSIFFSSCSFHSKLQRFEMTAFKPLSLKSTLGQHYGSGFYLPSQTKFFRENNILFCVYVAFKIKIQIVGTVYALPYCLLGITYMGKVHLALGC